MVMNNIGKHTMKTLLASGLVLFSHLLMPVAGADTLDKIAVEINGDIITHSEIKQRITLLQRSDKAVAAAPAAEQQQLALDALILEKLQLQYAKDNNLQVDDTIVDQTMERIAQQNNMNLPTFQAALHKQGINYLQFREQTRSRLTIERLRQAQARNSVAISSSEIQDAITNSQLMRGKRYRLEHLLIAAPNGTSVAQINQARQQANTLRQRIIVGETFTAIAANLTSAPDSTDYNGWHSDASLPPDLLRALSLLEAGEVAEVVQDSAGFHIVRLLEASGGNGTSSIADDNNPEALRTRASNAIGERKLDAYYRIWLQGLRNSAYIRVLDQRQNPATPNPQQNPQ